MAQYVNKNHGFEPIFFCDLKTAHPRLKAPFQFSQVRALRWLDGVGIVRCGQPSSNPTQTRTNGGWKMCYLLRWDFFFRAYLWVLLGVYVHQWLALPSTSTSWNNNFLDFSSFVGSQFPSQHDFWDEDLPTDVLPSLKVNPLEKVGIFLFSMMKRFLYLTSFVPSMEFAKIIYTKKDTLTGTRDSWIRKHRGQRWLCRPPYKGNSIGSCGKWSTRPPGKRTARSWKCSPGKGIIVFEVTYMVSFLIRCAWTFPSEDLDPKDPVCRILRPTTNSETFGYPSWPKQLISNISKTELAQLNSLQLRVFSSWSSPLSDIRTSFHCSKGFGTSVCFKIPKSQGLVVFFSQDFSLVTAPIETAAARYEQNYTYYISTRVAQAADPQPGAWAVEVGLDGDHEKIQSFKLYFFGGFLWKKAWSLFSWRKMVKCHFHI